VKRPGFFVAAILLAGALAFGVAPLQAQSADTSAAAQRGFAALDRYRTSESLEHASEAAREFAAAVKSGPKDAIAHYGLALTLYNAKKTMTVVRQQGIADGEAIFVAKRLLEKALDLDPQYVEAAELLVKVAEKTKDKKALARAHAIVPPERIATPKLDTAANVLTRAPTGAVDFVRRAAVLYTRGEVADAYEAYQQGLAVWDEAGAKAYVDDVLITADRQEAISLTDGTLEKRKAALQKFWQKRAVRGGISIPDRIAEHYRRLNAARTRYGLNLKPGQHLPLTVFGKERQGVERELDDRGLVYVRYGQPTHRVRARDYVEPIDGSPTGQESWVYRDADGRHVVYHFFGGRMEADLLRAFNRPQVAGPASSQALRELLADLSEYDHRYAFIAARMETVRNYETMKLVTQDAEGRRAINRRIAERLEDADRQNDRITQRNREVLFAAFDADAAFPRFDRSLTLFHDFATFRGKGCTDVVYSVASPTSAYRLSVALADTFTWETQSVDTVVMKGTAVGQYLRSTGVMCTTPDYNAYVRFTASTDSITGVTTGGELRVPDYSSPGLLMSDLLFGLDEDGPFVRGNAKLALVPPRQFRQKQPFRLFYEIYNLPAGGKYRTTLKFDVKDGNPLVRLFKGNNTVTLSFEGEATEAGLVQEIRTLAPEIEDGEVELTVTVLNLATGETATNKEKLWILPAVDD
jgi:tetratricopeptide (TPR) repeat protein